MGFTISMKEDEAAFTDAFKAVKDALRCFFQYDWSPMLAKADSAGAIHNALLNGFPHVKVAKCDFHMRQTIVQNKSRFSTEANYEQFMAETETLASLSSEEQFLAALELFKQKWQRKERSLMTI